MELMDEECRLECSKACNMKTCCGSRQASLSKSTGRLKSIQTEPNKLDSMPEDFRYRRAISEPKFSPDSSTRPGSTAGEPKTGAGDNEE